MSPDPQDLVYRSIVGAIFISGLYMMAHGILQSFMLQELFEPPSLDEWTIPRPPTHPPSPRIAQGFVVVVIGWMEERIRWYDAYA